MQERKAPFGSVLSRTTERKINSQFSSNFFLIGPDGHFTSLSWPTKGRTSSDDRARLRVNYLFSKKKQNKTKQKLQAPAGEFFQPTSNAYLVLRKKRRNQKNKENQKNKKRNFLSLQISQQDFFRLRQVPASQLPPAVCGFAAISPGSLKIMNYTAYTKTLTRNQFACKLSR